MSKSTRRIDGKTILINPKHCPACRTDNTISHDRRQCRKCQTFLFGPQDNFNQVERDAIAIFWVWFPLNSVSKSRRGWVHRDHLDVPAPVMDPTPYEIKPLKPNVGKPKDPRVSFTGDRMLG